MTGIDIETGYSPNYRRINSSGMYGSVQPFGLEAIVYSQEPVVDKVLGSDPIRPDKASIKRVVECALIIDPMQMKSIHTWLDQKIKQYEQLFGRIPSPEEVENRTKRDPRQ
ncbi:MAG TPA: hypothetical protein VJP79_01155 [Nitrososphaera sp.]|nr:hypothetical protein [Nitrososphaera sp.]